MGRGLRLAQTDSPVIKGSACGHQLAQIGVFLQSLTSQVTTLSVSSQPSLPDPSPASITIAHPEVPMPPLETFSGDLDRCRGFLMQCTILFRQRPQTFASDVAKVSYVVGLWGAEHWSGQRQSLALEPTRYPLHGFRGRARESLSARANEASRQFTELRQGQKGMEEHSQQSPAGTKPLCRTSFAMG